ncbi:alpha/beta hydrolase family protein [Sphingomonas sp. SRS2]|uniref:alpha/beta hydrolase family protein n=1 Tax=Sphingomonas sp. SRS2 TaxID=133190 RepID=UPI000618469B|nr:S9 family peptidase [Sphingomonas sp. SRS2]KKC24232.1 peptidase S9 [Sphingomonas sp. SRS2]
MSIRGMAACFALALMAPAAAAETDLAAAFGAREQLQDVSLSPDGARLAYIVPTKGQGSALLTITPGKDANPSVALVVGGDPERLGGCNWISNDRLVCALWGVTPNTSESAAFHPRLSFSRIVAIDANGGNPKMLSKSSNQFSRGYNRYGGEVIDWLPEEDGIVLMTRNQLADDRLGTRLGAAKPGIVVDKINTRTMATSKIESPRENVVDYISDRHGAVRVMGVEQIDRHISSGTTRYYYRVAGSREWQPLSDYNSVNRTGFWPQAIDYERNAVYGFRKKDGLMAVFRVSLDGSKKEELVFSHPQVDVDELIHIGRRHRVVGVSYATDIREAKLFDADLAKLTASLSRALPDQPLVRVVDSSADEKKLLIWAGSDKDPGIYYILDRATREMAIFQPVRPQLEGVKLAKVQPVTYAAADGTVVPAYLTLPAEGSGKNLPAIVMPHGGPGARDEWGFDWLSQYYAARGYAVLQPNFRGSSGYGDDWFQINGFQSWRVAIGDVTDAGRWLIKQGIANPAKLAIVGWSYGGYAALQSAVVDPGLFKAVVAIAPVTDLPALKEKARWYTNYELTKDFIGSGPQTIEGSPARNAGRIKSPVFLVHGTYDENVDIEQSKLMDSKLREAGVPHELIVFDERDHYLDDGEARAKLLRDSDAFLRKSMGM